MLARRSHAFKQGEDQKKAEYTALVSREKTKRKLSKRVGKQGDAQ